MPALTNISGFLASSAFGDRTLPTTRLGYFTEKYRGRLSELHAGIWEKYCDSKQYLVARHQPDNETEDWNMSGGCRYCGSMSHWGNACAKKPKSVHAPTDHKISMMPQEMTAFPEASPVSGVSSFAPGDIMSAWGAGQLGETQPSFGNAQGVSRYNSVYFYADLCYEG